MRCRRAPAALWCGARKPLAGALWGHREHDLYFGKARQTLLPGSLQLTTLLGPSHPRGVPPSTTKHAERVGTRGLSLEVPAEPAGREGWRRARWRSTAPGLPECCVGVCEAVHMRPIKETPGVVRLLVQPPPPLPPDLGLSHFASAALLHVLSILASPAGAPRIRGTTWILAPRHPTS